MVPANDYTYQPWYQSPFEMFHLFIVHCGQT